jgi:hypothetical protein
MKFFLGICALFLLVDVRGDDWPQWRGPNRDGTGAGLDAALIGRLRPAVPGELIAAGGVYAPVDVTAAVGRLRS